MGSGVNRLNKRKPLIKQRFDGVGYIAGEESGVVSADGVPAVKPIFLFDQDLMLLIRSTFSDENGNYRLSHLDPSRKYVVLSCDETGEFSPVCVDHVTPYVP